MGKHWVTEGRLEASGQFLYSFFFENFLQFYQVIWWKFTYFHLFWYIKGCVKYTVCAWILCCRCRRKDILVFLISFQSLLYLWIFLFDMHTETYVVWWVDLPMTSKLVQQFLERRLPFLSYYLFFFITLHFEAISQNLFSSHTLKRPASLHGMLVHVHWGDDTEVGEVFTIRSDNTWRGARRITEETWTSLVKHILLSTYLPNGDVDFDIVIPLFMNIKYMNLFSNIYSQSL